MKILYLLFSLQIFACNNYNNKSLTNIVSQEGKSEVLKSDVELLLNKKSYDLNSIKKMHLTIINHSKEIIFFGNEYDLYYLGKKWERVKNDYFFNDIGYKLLPNNSINIPIKFKENAILKNGTYMIKKKVRTETTNYEKSIKFNIKNGR